MDTLQLQGLYRYCFCLTADPARAEDLLQTALEKWLRCDKQPEYSRAYMRKIIRNQFFDDCRHNKVIDFEPIEDHSPALLDETCFEEIEIQHNLIEYIFSQLTPADREVLCLWAIDGYSAAEIAVDLGQPRGTILSRLYRIKQKVTDISASEHSLSAGGV